MAAKGETLAGLRNRTMLLIIAGTLVVLLIWFVAYFSPSGKKLDSVNAQTQSAQTEQSELNAQLTRLRTYANQAGALIQLSDRLTAALPTTIDIYDYITALSNAAGSTGVNIQSISPSAPASAPGKVTVIPVEVTVQGDYDQMLAFMKALYALPRLTVIQSVQLSGGGANTNRGTQLSASFDLDIFALAGAPTTSTTTGG
jgi:Tfp pilus assembly protein PilO